MKTHNRVFKRIEITNQANQTMTYLVSKDLFHMTQVQSEFFKTIT
jgi:hypothetical protein